MTSPKKSKNLVTIHGLPYYDRWTVLNVPVSTVETIIAYKKLVGAENLGEALERMVNESKVVPRKHEVIGLDYWQVISHYQEYFKELAERMMAAGHEVHIVSAVGQQREKQVFADIDKTGVPYTKKHKVVFEHPVESPQLKLSKCQELGVTVFYDDRDDVCRLLNANGITAFRVTRKDNSRYDLEAEQR